MTSTVRHTARKYRTSRKPARNHMANLPAGDPDLGVAVTVTGTPDKPPIPNPGSAVRPRAEGLQPGCAGGDRCGVLLLVVVEVDVLVGDPSAVAAVVVKAGDAGGDVFHPVAEVVE